MVQSKTAQARLNSYSIDNLSQMHRNLKVNVNSIGSSKEGSQSPTIYSLSSRKESSNASLLLDDIAGRYNPISHKSNKTGAEKINLDNYYKGTYRNPYTFTTPIKQTTAEKFAKAWFNEEEVRKAKKERDANIGGMLGKSDEYNLLSLAQRTLPRVRPANAIDRQAPPPPGPNAGGGGGGGGTQILQRINLPDIVNPPDASYRNNPYTYTPGILVPDFSARRNVVGNLDFVRSRQVLDRPSPSNNPRDIDSAIGGSTPSARTITSAGSPPMTPLQRSRQGSIDLANASLQSTRNLINERHPNIDYSRRDNPPIQLPSPLDIPSTPTPGPRTTTTLRQSSHALPRYIAPANRGRGPPTP